MAESGSTNEQIESFIRNSQKVPELPASEPLWSLSDLSTSYNTQPVDTCPVAAEKHRKTFARKPFTKSSWPPTNWKTARDCNFSAELEHAPAASFIDPDVNFDMAYSATSFDIDKLWLDTTENQQSYNTGRLGEMIAYKYFTEKLGLKDVKWVNNESETGLPYDLILGEKGKTEYVEVKTTASALRNWFHISANEWQCASKNGDAFILARVILSSPTSAKIIVTKNSSSGSLLHDRLLFSGDFE